MGRYLFDSGPEELIRGDLADSIRPLDLVFGEAEWVPAAVRQHEHDIKQPLGIYLIEDHLFERSQREAQRAKKPRSISKRRRGEDRKR